MPEDRRNGVPASSLPDVIWRKSTHSNSQGDCVELASLPEGTIAIRNSRYPAGPALIWPRPDIGVFIRGARDGDFDDLLS